MQRGIAYRRHKDLVYKKKAEDICLNIYKLDCEKPEKIIGILSKTRPICSCAMCSHLKEDKIKGMKKLLQKDLQEQIAEVTQW